MGPISYSVTLHYVGKACQGKNSSLLGPLISKGEYDVFVKITPVVSLFITCAWCTVALQNVTNFRCESYKTFSFLRQFNAPANKLECLFLESILKRSQSPEKDCPLSRIL
jgi:hypothetical protein